MITKQTTVQIEITPTNGVVQIRMSLSLMEDGVQLSNKFHRTTLPPGIDIDAQMGFVNEHLIQMNQNPVSAADIERIKAHCALEWTPEVLAAYQARTAEI